MVGTSIAFIEKIVLKVSVKGSKRIQAVIVKETPSVATPGTSEGSGISRYC